MKDREDGLRSELSSTKLDKVEKKVNKVEKHKRFKYH